MVRRLAFSGVVAVAIALVFGTVRRDVHGLSLVVRAADLDGVGRRLADLDAVRAHERLVAIPAPAGAMRARVYSPIGRSHQTVLLVSGLHPDGIDEQRLRFLAGRLAEARVTVVTPDIRELSEFEVTPAVTDGIERAARWLAEDPVLAPSHRIGLMGVSFSGGLAVVAAGREPIRDHLLYVFSLGGHDDLRHVLDFFCGESDGVAERPPSPHDYGVAVALLNVAPRLVPAEQVDPLRAAVRRFLTASYLDRFDKSAAEREFAAIRETARSLDDPAATLLRYVSDRDVAHLGPTLRPFIGGYVDQPALSPALSPPPTAPVYLLHGRDDTVIPAQESRDLARRLDGRVPVRLLITDLISHADADQPPHLNDVLRLADFWGDLLQR